MDSEKNRMPQPSFIGWLILLAVAFSCREPLERDCFIKGSGPYVFTVEMGDTTAAYDFALYTRVDGRTDGRQSLPMDLHWRAPSDRLYSETVYLPLQGKRADGSLQVYAPYREDVRPYEAGTWTLTLSIPDSVALSGMRGMGLLVTRRKTIWDTEN